jgi:CheY-like chemotaxis protein
MALNNNNMNEPQRTIGLKLGLISFSLIVALLVVGVLSVNALMALKQNVNDIVDVSAKKVQLGEKIQQDLLKITRAGKNIITAQTQDEMDGFSIFIENTHGDLIRRLNSAELLVDQNNRAKIDKIRQKITEYMVVNSKIRKYARLNSNAEARSISATLARKAFDKAESRLRKIILEDDRITEIFKKQAADSQLRVIYGTQIQNNMLLILRAERNIILSTNVTEMLDYAATIKALEEDLFRNQSALRQLVVKDGNYNLDNFERTWQKWRNIYDQVLDFTLLNSNVRAVNLSTGAARQSFEALESALFKMGVFYENRFWGDDNGIVPNKQVMVQSGYIIQLSSSLLRNVVGYQRAEKNLILAPTQNDKDIYMQIMSDLEVEIDTGFDRLQLELETGKEDMTSFHNSKQAYHNYRFYNTEVRKLSRENGNRRAFDLAKSKGRQLADQAEKQLEFIVDGNVKLNDHSANQLALANDRMLVASRIIQDMFAIHRAEKSLILEKTQQGMDVFADSIESFEQDLSVKLKRFKTVASVEELNDLSGFEKYWLEFMVVNGKVRELSRKNGNQLAFDLSSSEGRELADQAEVLISDLVTENEKSMSIDRNLSNEVFEQYFTIIYLTIFLSIILGGAFSFFMIRNTLSVITKFSDKNEQSQWLKTARAEVTDVLGGGSEIDVLSNAIISTMVRFLGGSVGIIYFSNDDDSFSQSGCYALSTGDHVSKPIRLGVGTVGQAILEADTIILSELPDDYLAINSGIGEAIPRYLVVVPLKLEGKVIGALEIGSLKPFTPLQIDLTELVSGTIAVAMRVSKNQSELLKINHELSAKTEALVKHKNEIELNNVSMKRTQSELKEKALELELSGIYKSQFLSNMSHELRTPLNSMILLAKDLVSDRYGNLNDEQIEDAKIIFDGSNDLLSLVNDIMDLSKVEAGMLTVNYDVLILKTLTANLQRLFNPVSTSRNLKFEVDIADTVPDSIITDGQRLEQILKNFLSNAFKFTDTGKVILRVSSLRAGIQYGLKECENQNLLVFSVIDTGIGMPEHEQQLAFNAFQQLDGTTSRKHGGTGLGLSISLELASLLGGEILLDSKVDEGSSFSLYLPIDTDAESGLRKISPAGVQETPLLDVRIAASAIEPLSTQLIADDRNSIELGDQTILIIEGDPVITHSLMKTVHSNGYKCLTAADGRNGLYLSTEFQLHGILLDMDLPDIDGLEVIKQLTYQARTASVPIQIISEHDCKSKVIASGGTGYLQKSATREDIESALGEITRLSEKHCSQILVVNKGQDSQGTIVSLFDGFTIEFTFASNSKDACRHIKSMQFDVVIVDLNLPGMSEFDILDKVSKDSKKALPSIIFYTGHKFTDEENERLAGFNSSVIVKGAESPDRLIDEVAMFLHSDVVKGQSDEKQEVGMLHNDEILFRDRTILLVDDVIANIYILSRQLERLGFNVLTAENGQEALDKLNENLNIELVLMDIMMPVMDGYEAMRKIRGSSKLAELPVIALTAKAMPEDRALCIESGASEYLIKPLNFGKLKAMLRVWLFKHTEVTIRS